MHRTTRLLAFLFQYRQPWLYNLLQASLHALHGGKQGLGETADVSTPNNLLQTCVDRFVDRDRHFLFHNPPRVFAANEYVHILCQLKS